MVVILLRGETPGAATVSGCKAPCGLLAVLRNGVSEGRAARGGEGIVVGLLFAGGLGRFCAGHQRRLPRPPPPLRPRGGDRLLRLRQAPPRRSALPTPGPAARPPRLHRLDGGVVRAPPCDKRYLRPVRPDVGGVRCAAGAGGVLRAAAGAGAERGAGGVHAFSGVGGVAAAGAGVPAASFGGSCGGFLRLGFPGRGPVFPGVGKCCFHVGSGLGVHPVLGA
mmetsp:Transcript_33666/g.81480  ORF Transcript_33666/g.81480 Transcript_33666/m.81480 type:complete len:222 (-) Transcript_33666:317-982(-)